MDRNSTKPWYVPDRVAGIWSTPTSSQAADRSVERATRSDDSGVERKRKIGEYSQPWRSYGDMTSVRDLEWLRSPRPAICHGPRVGESGDRRRKERSEDLNTVKDGVHSSRLIQQKLEKEEPAEEKEEEIDFHVFDEEDDCSSLYNVWDDEPMGVRTPKVESKERKVDVCTKNANEMTAPEWRILRPVKSEVQDSKEEEEEDRELLWPPTEVGKEEQMKREIEREIEREEETLSIEDEVPRGLLTRRRVAYAKKQRDKPGITAPDEGTRGRMEELTTARGPSEPMFEERELFEETFRVIVGNSRATREARHALRVLTTSYVIMIWLSLLTNEDGGRETCTGDNLIRLCLLFYCLSNRNLDAYSVRWPSERFLASLGEVEAEDAPVRVQGPGSLAGEVLPEKLIEEDIDSSNPFWPALEPMADLESPVEAGLLTAEAPECNLPLTITNLTARETTRTEDATDALENAEPKLEIPRAEEVARTPNQQQIDAPAIQVPQAMQAVRAIDQVSSKSSPPKRLSQEKKSKVRKVKEMKKNLSDPDKWLTTDHEEFDSVKNANPQVVKAITIGTPSSSGYRKSKRPLKPPRLQDVIDVQELVARPDLRGNTSFQQTTQPVQSPKTLEVVSQQIKDRLRSFKSKLPTDEEGHVLTRVKTNTPSVFEGAHHLEGRTVETTEVAGSNPLILIKESQTQLNQTAQIAPIIQIEPEIDNLSSDLVTQVIGHIDSAPAGYGPVAFSVSTSRLSDNTRNTSPNNVPNKKRSPESPANENLNQFVKINKETETENGEEKTEVLELEAPGRDKRQQSSQRNTRRAESDNRPAESRIQRRNRHESLPTANEPKPSIRNYPELAIADKKDEPKGRKYKSMNRELRRGVVQQKLDEFIGKKECRRATEEDSNRPRVPRVKEVKTESNRRETGPVEETQNTRIRTKVEPKVQKTKTSGLRRKMERDVRGIIAQEDLQEDIEDSPTSEAVDRQETHPVTAIANTLPRVAEREEMSASAPKKTEIEEGFMQVGTHDQALVSETEQLIIAKENEIAEKQERVEQTPPRPAIASETKKRFVIPFDKMVTETKKLTSIITEKPIDSMPAEKEKLTKVKSQSCQKKPAHRPARMSAPPKKKNTRKPSGRKTRAPKKKQSAGLRQETSLEEKETTDPIELLRRLKPVRPQQQRSSKSRDEAGRILREEKRREFKQLVANSKTPRARNLEDLVALIGDGDEGEGGGEGVEEEGSFTPPKWKKNQSEEEEISIGNTQEKKKDVLSESHQDLASEEEGPPQRNAYRKVIIEQTARFEGRKKLKHNEEIDSEKSKNSGTTVVLDEESNQFIEHQLKKSQQELLTLGLKQNDFKTPPPRLPANVTTIYPRTQDTDTRGQQELRRSQDQKKKQTKITDASWDKDSKSRSPSKSKGIPEAPNRR